MSDRNGNVTCAKCGVLAWASRARPLCLHCARADGLEPFDAFRAWLAHADDEELLAAVESFRRDTGEGAGFGVLVESIHFREYVIQYIRARAGYLVAREEVNPCGKSA